MNMKTFYEIMHGDDKVAVIGTDGRCRIYMKGFMPYNLFLDDEGDDFDSLFNNLTNFYFWCASRMLTLDRAFAKEILNSIGASQAGTDRERAQIALSYHCLCLTDIYWVKTESENVCFRDINLFENHLSNAFIDVALRGRQISVGNSHLIADDISTNGLFPKAWIRRNNGFYLLKDGGADVVDMELLASKICRCFSCRQVIYEEAFYDNTKVTESEIITSLRYSIVSRESFEIYALNHDLDALKYILELDGYSYYMMNILDYLIGNTDRHWGNWGLLIDNSTNLPLRLHDLMDFNKAFSSYDSLEGANCLTVDRNSPRTQRQAALEAVAQVGLNQTAEIDRDWFGKRDDLFEMFSRRLWLLKGDK
ncbi:hypothetical protein NXH76_15050 [Blautia schinkii]|nr:hypothetical protein [Blautia schinkii]